MGYENRLAGRPSRAKQNTIRDQTLAERFFSKVNPVPNENGCWEWIASCRNYWDGQLHYKGKWYSAPRLSYEMHKGKIPVGLHVCHTCDNPKCVNPEHLWLGTHQDNMKDRMIKKRGNVPKGEKCKGAKLSELQITEIRDKHKKGITQTALGKEYKVTQSAIWYAVQNKTWKEVRA